MLAAYVAAAKEYQAACEREALSRAALAKSEAIRRDAYSRFTSARDAWLRLDAWARRHRTVEYVVGFADILGELDGD